MTLLPQTPPLRAEIFPAAFERQMQAVSASLAVAIGECWPKTALGKDGFGGCCCGSFPGGA